MAQSCSHLKQIKFKSTETDVCEDCIKTGDTWVHLRLCLECGHVGCCDSSKNKHATKHFHRTKHPLSVRLSRAKRGSGAMWMSSRRVRLRRECLRHFPLDAGPMPIHLETQDRRNSRTWLNICSAASAS